MPRLVILASVVMLAAISVNCANSPERSNANILAPSASDAAILVATGGHGGGKPGTGGGSGGSLTLAMVTDNNKTAPDDPETSLYPDEITCNTP